MQKNNQSHTKIGKKSGRKISTMIQNIIVQIHIGNSVAKCVTDHHSIWHVYNFIRFLFIRFYTRAVFLKTYWYVAPEKLYSINPISMLKWKKVFFCYFFVVTYTVLSLWKLKNERFYSHLFKYLLSMELRSTFFCCKFVDGNFLFIVVLH